MKALTLLRPKALVRELHRPSTNALDRIDEALDEATAVANRITHRGASR